MGRSRNRGADRYLLPGFGTLCGAEHPYSYSHCNFYANGNPDTIYLHPDGDPNANGHHNGHSNPYSNTDKHANGLCNPYSYRHELSNAHQYRNFHTYFDAFSDPVSNGDRSISALSAADPQRMG